jgi:hypothetical protein
VLNDFEQEIIPSNDLELACYSTFLEPLKSSSRKSALPTYGVKHIPNEEHHKQLIIKRISLIGAHFLPVGL